MNVLDRDVDVEDVQTFQDCHHFCRLFFEGFVYCFETRKHIFEEGSISAYFTATVDYLSNQPTKLPLSSSKLNKFMLKQLRSFLGN